MSIASRFSAKAWQGATAGGILALTVALVTMPASIMMNANVHHHPVLRIIMGFFGAALNVLTIIYAMIFMRGRNYYGLFPLVAINIPPSPQRFIDWPWWLFKNIPSMLLFMLSIFSRGNTAEDTGAFKNQVIGLFDGKGPFVDEDLLAGARAAAQARDGPVWESVMRELEPVGKKIYKGLEAKAGVDLTIDPVTSATP